jgi:S-adenosylmethionine-diacylglycerol 3-amino-3-carboxypropyl transferase
MGSFYSRLSYSFGNEDWETEHKALQITSQDRVLCVTASGDRPLNLLTKELHQLITIDANPLQNALFDLKRAALSSLPYDDYLAFMGATPSSTRLKIYKQLEKTLDPMSSALWELAPRKIAQGILYQGSVERLLKITSRMIRLLRGPSKVDKLFANSNLQQQQQFVAEHWHTYLWEKAFHILLHPVVTRTFVKDPGLYAYVDPKFHVGNQLYERIHDYLNRHLASESPLLSLILNGKVHPHHFPPYLRKEDIKKIKKQLHKTQFHTDDLISYVSRAPACAFDCFSLSDVASYMSKEDFMRLMEGILHSAKPGARFCIRQLLTNHQIPPHLAPHFKRNITLDQQLQQEDRCCVYAFMTGIIDKT